MFVRYATAVSSGTFVTLGLLYVMQFLITTPAGIEEPTIPGIPVWIVPSVEERPVETIDLQKTFEDIKDPLEANPPRPGPDFRVDAVRVSTVRTPLPNKTGLGNLKAIADGPLVSIIRVQPIYPAIAAEKELEGFVDVQFDVNADGSVTNVSVLQSTHKIFEKEAIRAAKKFRFKARVVDGVPQPSFGLQNRFRFRMERT